MFSFEVILYDDKITKSQLSRNEASSCNNKWIQTKKNCSSKESCGFYMWSASLLSFTYSGQQSTQSPLQVISNISNSSAPLPTGLINQGNSCFLNAVLQALASTNSLLPFLYKIDRPISSSLLALLNRMFCTIFIFCKNWIRIMEEVQLVPTCYDQSWQARIHY